MKINKLYQIYEKRDKRWYPIMEPMSKDEAESLVKLMKTKINDYEKSLANANRHGKTFTEPDPGFREPHCVPV
jgi:hypothetical protein